MNTAWQQTLDSVLRVDESTWSHSYRDYWGTRVRIFEAHRPHRELLVDASSLVEIDASRMPTPDLAIGWDTLRSEATIERFGEYLTQTHYTEPAEHLISQTVGFVETLSPHEAALAICALVHDRMTYMPGSTGVHTTAADSWNEHAGVCQDYAHIVVGVLRYFGLPARYASGYLHPTRDPEIGETAVGESHAWVEWWLGAWSGHDPTNDVPIAERHVLVGRGRDYGDVPPIRGLVAGPSGASHLDVTVEITRLA